MRGINGVAISPDKTRARVQGGAIISDVITAAYASGVQVLTGNCNCVGVLGSSLGGGYGHLLGLHGFAVDNIVSLDVVLADGSLTTVSSANSDLFWAFRGAGPNFGIVTAAVFKAYPVTVAQNLAWTGVLVFTPDKIEALVQAIQDLTLHPQMLIYMVYATVSSTPVVLINPFYHGTAAQGKAAFASIYAIGPVQDTTAETPYNRWNDGSQGFCIDGERKPAHRYVARNLELVYSISQEQWHWFKCCASRGIFFDESSIDSGVISIVSKSRYQIQRHSYTVVF